MVRIVSTFHHESVLKVIRYFFEEMLGLAQRVMESVKTTLPKILAVTRHLEEDPGVEGATKMVAETAMLLCACSKTREEAVKITALVVVLLDSRRSLCLSISFDPALTNSPILISQ